MPQFSSVQMGLLSYIYRSVRKLNENVYKELIIVQDIAQRIFVVKMVTEENMNPCAFPARSGIDQEHGRAALSYVPGLQWNDAQEVRS